MGFKTTSTRFTQARSAQSSDFVAYNNAATGNASITGTSLSANSVITTVTVTPGANASSGTTTTSGGASITIASVQYLDANNAVISGDIAVSTLGGNILINGTGFVANSTVYVNNSLVANTFISSTQIRAILPAASAGNVALMIFTPSNVGGIKTNGVRYSGVPTWTTAAASFQNATAANVALVASSDSTLTYTLQAGSTLPTGISLNSAGYLTGTATGYSTNTSSTAVIVATDAEGQATQQTLNITVTTADPQFPYTMLLLNGETSVTPFIADASTNSFGLTIAGDTKANKFSPYYGNGYYSVQFNGTVNDYLSVPHNSGLSIMSGDTGTFVAECWVYWTTVNASCVIMDKSGRNGVSFQNWSVELDASKYFKLVWGASGTPGTSAIGVLTTSIIPVAGQWYHVAFVKSNADWSLFINGTRATTYNGLNTANDANPAALRVGLGIDGEYNVGYLSGYVSNVRVYNGPAGSAPYAATSTTITVPTAPLTTAASVYALTNQSARYLDNSTTNATITPGTGVKISPAIPFAASSSYATYGGAYFDGTGDYLSLVNSAFWTIPTATTPLTVEAWVYPTTTASGTIITEQFTGASNPVSLTLSLGSAVGSSTTSNKVWFGYYTGSGWGGAISASTLSANTWSHVAGVFTGSTINIYINGVLDGTPVSSSSWQTTASTTGYIGRNWDDTSITYFTGYISDARVVKGTALYTSNFTPPTAPLTAVANTQLLALQYNGGANNYGIIDNSTFQNVITRSGNATQGTFSPYSQVGWSNYFNGTSSLQTPATSITNIIGTNGITTTSTFTIECWIYQTQRQTGTVFPAMMGDLTPAGTNCYFGFGPTSTGLLQFFWYDGANKSATGSTTIPLNTWTHVAVSISSGSVKLFVNGNLETITGTSVLTNATGTTGYFAFGMENSGGSGANAYFGYISNLRIVKSALYSTTFTPSTTPLTAVANTGLLTGQSNRFADSSSNAYTLTLTGTPSVQAFSPFAPSAAYTPSLHGGSAYFDGTGDYLTFTEPSIVPAGTDATLELWVYPTSFTARNFLYSGGPAGAGAVAISLEATSGAAGIWIDGYGAPRFSTTTANPVLNQWNHIALVKTSGVVYCYVNGVKDAGSYTHAAAFGSGAASTIGAYNVNKGQLTFGYLSDVRYTKNVSVYTGATATVPTTALSSNTNTALLLNFTNGGIIDQHSTNIFESLAGTQISTAVKKYGNASLSFSGASSASLQFPATSQATWFGTGDFTVECWVNFTSSNGTYNPFVRYDGTGTFDFGYDFSTTQLKYSGSAAIFAVTQTFTPGTWYHVAVTRASGSSRLFVNGTQVGSTATGDTNNYAAGAFKVGGSSFSTGHIMNGYIDDLRITKGFARYTANFTAPTSAFLGQ
jgi:hypothetical protein